MSEAVEPTGAGPTQHTRLTGSGCPECGVVCFPAGAACPRCGAAMVERMLSSEGELWTWTVQRFPPKTPPYEPVSEPFEPFGVGYVELPEGVRVAAIIETADLAGLRIGMRVRLASHAGVPRFAPVAAPP